MALTDRQKQIKGLQQEGKKAPEIAEALGISTNAVYQQLRRMKPGKGGAKAAAKPAAKAAAPKAAAAVAAPKAAPVKERPPLTPEKALKFERDAIAADLKVTSVELESARKAVEKAEAAHAAALDGKRERVLQIDGALEALTGTRPDPLKGFETPEQLQAAEEAARVEAEEAAKAAAEDGAKAEADAAHAAAEASQEAPEAVQEPVPTVQATATPEKPANGASKAATKTAAKAKPKPAAKPAAAKPAAEPKTQAEREAAPEFTEPAVPVTA